jgi:hypothetical protein
VEARVVEGCGGVEDGVLGEEEDFGDVEGEVGGAFDAGLCERGLVVVGGEERENWEMKRRPEGKTHLNLLVLLHDRHDLCSRSP